MRKKFLRRVNVLLGIVSLSLAGCHTQKNAAQTQPAEPEASPAQAVGGGEVICMYGIPAEVYEEQRAKEEAQRRRDSLQNDTTAQEAPERIMMKYGVPYPRSEKK